MRPYYQDELVTLYCGDCREVVPALGRFDLMLTDPPYGIGASAGTGKYGREKWTESDPKWDTSAPSRWVFDMLLERVDRAVVWGGNYFQLPASRNYFVWDKGAGFRGRDFAECEVAWVSWDGNAKVYTRDPLASRDYENKQHPTEKPVAVMTWCLVQTPLGPESRILDPFAGVCSTGIAAKNMGLSCVLVEREERYCEMGAKRLGQGVLTGMFNQRDYVFCSQHRGIVSVADATKDEASGMYVCRECAA